MQFVTDIERAAQYDPFTVDVRSVLKRCRKQVPKIKMRKIVSSSKTIPFYAFYFEDGEEVKYLSN